MICRLFLDSLAAARHRFGFELFAWVIMPEHVHLLLRPRAGAPLDRSLLAIKLSVAKRVLGRWVELEAPILSSITTQDGHRRYWQAGGGFDRNVRNESEFCREVRYIHRNPVARGLVESPEHWPWSSVRWWMGDREGELPCDPPPGDPRSWVAWKGFM